MSAPFRNTQDSIAARGVCSESAAFVQVEKPGLITPSSYRQTEES
jgi:hypothetical protein